MPQMIARFVRMAGPSWSRKKRTDTFFRSLFFRSLLMCAVLAAQAAAHQQPAPQGPGIIRGTVKDSSGAVVAGAVVTLEASESKEPRTAITDEAGRFQFSAVTAPTCTITITAGGFAAWTAQDVAPGSGENPMVIPVVLRVAPASTEVNVKLPPHELAAEQIKAEEKQRVLGIFPNFFVNYDPNPAPLTAKQKFQLGWKTFSDPVPILFSALGAGIQQKRNSYPEYGQGVEGFSKRFGANYAGHVSSVLVGHVVMQAVFHQDPRYFYKGAGSFGSRALYAIATAFVAKGDNGHWQPAYADVLGSMASYGISTLYRPGTSRPGLRLEHTILLGFAGRAGHHLFQEFVLRQITTHVPTAAASGPVLRAGTPVTLISMEDLSAKTAGNAGPIGFVLAGDLQVGGAVVAKAGSQAWGRVNYTAAPGAGGLSLDLDGMHLTAGGTDVPLRSTLVRDGGRAVEYHRLENSGKIVIVLYVDRDVIPEKKGTD